MNAAALPCLLALLPNAGEAPRFRGLNGLVVELRQPAKSNDSGRVVLLISKHDGTTVEATFHASLKEGRPYDGGEIHPRAKERYGWVPSDIRPGDRVELYLKEGPRGWLGGANVVYGIARPARPGVPEGRLVVGWKGARWDMPWWPLR